jgi:hypothetical protein
MIRVMIDAFSGRPNLHCILDGAKAKDIVQLIRKDPSLATPVSNHFDGLGFRGIIVDSLSSEKVFGSGLPHRLRIAGGGSTNERGARGLATQIIDAMTDREPALVADRALVTTLKTAANRSVRPSAPKRKSRKPAFSLKAEPGKPHVAAVKARDQTCYIEVDWLHPEFWSTPPVLYYNNCYNFASNWANNTFAQPGVGGGCGPAGLSVELLRYSIMCDGGLMWPMCAQSGDAPRCFMAACVWPGVDFHFYRFMAEGVWGHKPGCDTAREYDNSNNPIHDPGSCDRGDYTDFAGYCFSIPIQRQTMTGPGGICGGG